jgi:hypothetical protein
VLLVLLVGDTLADARASQSVKSEASKWPGYGQMTVAVNNGRLDADGREPTNTVEGSAALARGKRGRLAGAEAALEV